jgi:large conductance mechanosensitive channel
MWREFKAFLVKENVLALAIAVVIGAALAKVVSALVADFIMPIVTFAVPGGAWRTWTVDAGPVRFAVGDFIGALLDFLIIGFVVWRISKAFIRPKAAAAVKNCPFCVMAIDPAATRCPHCTSQLAAG